MEVYRFDPREGHLKQKGGPGRNATWAKKPNRRGIIGMRNPILYITLVSIRIFILALISQDWSISSRNSDRFLYFPDSVFLIFANA